MARRYALVIGNSEYEDTTLSQLKTPEADVHALASALRDPQVGGFDEVQEMINQPESAVRRAISAFFLQKKSDDLLLLYFSGHGVLDPQGRLFLAVKDSQRNLLNATAIPANFITDDMDSCRSKRQILILDCCHSGAFAKGAKGDAPAVTQSTFEGNGYGRVVLTASDSTQYALEGDQVIEQASFSLFTHYLLEGLISGEADIGQDGLITLDEWYDYAYDRVVGETPEQTPRKWTYNQQGELVIARNPNPPQLGPEDLPEVLKLAIQSPFVAVRADAVEELKRLLLGSNPAISQAAFQALENLAAHDDSKRIASAAGSALASYRQLAQPDQSEAEHEHQMAEKVEQKRQARDKAEVQPREAEKADAERQDSAIDEQEHQAQTVVRQQVTYLPFSSELRPHKVKAGEDAEVLIEVSGQDTVSFSVDFIDPSGEMDFAPPSAKVTVQPGYNAAVKFHAGLHQPPLFKLNPALPYKIQVAASTGEAQTLFGEVIVKPRLPLWSLAVVAMFGILIVFIGVFLMRPNPSVPSEVTLNSIDPNGAARGQEVEIGLFGSGFDGATSHAISIGEFEILDTWVESDEVIHAVIIVPEGAEPGPRDVTVSFDFDGEYQEVGLEGGFSVLAPQEGESALYSLEPSEVEIGQEVEIRLLGSGFAGASGLQISIGEFEIASSYVESDEVIRALIEIPADAEPGPRDVLLDLDFDGEQRSLSIEGGFVVLPLEPASTEASEGGANPPSEAGLRVVFASQRDGNWEIYTMNGDGSDVTRLTDDPRDDGSPVWSPDGSQILFHSDRAGNFDIYVMNADGSGLTQLTDDPRADTFPAWSPDGKKIAFQSKRDGNKEIYVMNANGANQRRLTNNPSDETYPTFSPFQGDDIGFVSDRDGNLEIYWMNSNGSEQTRLTWNEYDDNFPVWSPTENILLYTAVINGVQEIYTKNLDTGDEWELSGDTSGEDHPRWSPDGHYIVYDATHGPGSNGGVDSEIYLFDYWSDQAIPIRLTDNDVDDTAPAVK